MGRAVGLVALLLFIEVERAEACTCLERDPILSPADGATGVVRNPVIAARISKFSNVTLRTPAGHIAIDREQVAYDLALLRPRAMLSPNTTYEVLAEGSTLTFTTGHRQCLDERRGL